MTSGREQIREDNLRKIRIMKNVLAIGLLLTIAKFIAWKITGSNAILTDALESIINIVAAAFGLFSLVYSARPSDENHPYGHGKMEFLAVGFEGALIFLAGGGMIIKAVLQIFNPVLIEEVGIGIIITSFAAFINFIMGRALIIKGKKLNSSALIADGKHLVSDTVSSVGLVAGLALILLTKLYILDSILTILLGTYILIVGYKLLRGSLSGLMDEADFELLSNVISVLNRERRPAWIDIHNLRVLKYGSFIHVDAHLTLPWYENLEHSHDEVKVLEGLVKREFGNRVELFIHTDPCTENSCGICLKKDCQVRKFPMVKKLEWKAANLLVDSPHSAPEHSQSSGA